MLCFKGAYCTRATRTYGYGLLILNSSLKNYLLNNFKRKKLSVEFADALLVLVLLGLEFDNNSFN